MVISLLDEDGGVHQLAGTPWQVAADDLSAATGWTLKPEGLCRGSICVPLGNRSVSSTDGVIDLVEWAAALGYPLAVDADSAAAALAPVPHREPPAAVGSKAPELELPDVDGNRVSFSSLSGRKRVLVTWASWCGCRHELGAWRDLQDELGPLGLSIFSVALDNSTEDARPWVEAADPSYPVVVDTAHVTAERYGITNVPSTVWVDEAGVVVKPPTISPGDDQFRDFTQIAAATHHDALRRWVRDGELPATGVEGPAARTGDEQLALAEQRLGAYLYDTGATTEGQAHLRRAVELAPWDWTIRRANIKLRGDDPFLGDEFVAFWQEWDAAGRPGYGAMRDTGGSSAG
jgi:peroxiredoxin